MLKHPFSFEGRIGRGEYALSYGGYIALVAAMNTADLEGVATILSLLVFPAFWILLAQGAKRCHDMNHSGWWQIIPFYFFVMLFQTGDPGANEYGFPNSHPKEGTVNSLEKEIDSIGQNDIH